MCMLGILRQEVVVFEILPRVSWQDDVSVGAINTSYMCLLKNVCFNRNAQALETHAKTLYYDM